jgi:hypothetical protein
VWDGAAANQPSPQDLAAPWIDPQGVTPMVGSVDFNPLDDSVRLSTKTGLGRVPGDGGEPERVRGRLSSSAGEGEISEQLVVRIRGADRLIGSRHPLPAGFCSRTEAQAQIRRAPSRCCPGSRVDMSARGAYSPGRGIREGSGMRASRVVLAVGSHVAAHRRSGGGIAVAWGDDGDRPQRGRRARRMICSSSVGISCSAPAILVQGALARRRQPHRTLRDARTRLAAVSAHEDHRP